MRVNVPFTCQGADVTKGAFDRLYSRRNKNTWSDDENGMFGAFQSSTDDKNMFKIAF